MLPLKVKKSRRDAQKTVSEKIHEQFQSTSKGPAAPQSDDDDEDTRPRFSEFDENDSDLERTAEGRLSDFRKQNIRYLDSIDRKYQGKVSSRSDDLLEEEESEEELGDSASEESETDYQPGAFVKLNAGGSDKEDQKEDDDEDDYEDDDDEESDGNEYSLGDFLGTETNRTESQKLLQDENRQETIQKGVCVQNQLKMWEKLLEMRIKLQSSLITSNSFPHADKFSAFSQDEKFQQASEKVITTVESTLSNLLELQEVLVTRFPESKTILPSGTKRKVKADSKSNKKRSRNQLDEFEELIKSSYTCYTPYRNEVLQKWHDRTKAASSSAKNANQSLSIVKKIENALLSKDEVIRKTQLYRGGYKLFETPAQTQDTPKEDSPRDATDDQPQIYDGEIYDDSDFYHALLRELIEYKSNTADNPQEINAKLTELQKLRNKMKKQVDTRASKGRKIRYVVHKKLVNFTAPDDGHQWTEEAKDELFTSLFGGTNNL